MIFKKAKKSDKNINPFRLILESIPSTHSVEISHKMFEEYKIYFGLAGHNSVDNKTIAESLFFLRDAGYVEILTQDHVIYKIRKVIV